MYLEVLKFGSMIVDALRQCKQPVMVYLPKFSELRGGAWVVLDTQINPEFIEMYADPTARGGVLEASGTVEVVFREEQQRQVMKRSGGGGGVMTESNSNEYLIAAEMFADLHDTALHMETLGCIRAVVPWKQSRLFFFNRLRRRLKECEFEKLLSFLPTSAERKSRMQAWFQADGFSNTDLNNDEKVFRWFEQNFDSLTSRVSDAKKQFIIEQISRLATEAGLGVHVTAAHSSNEK
eukprot:c5621_g1_i1.p1 GENE.c5621_g1_i1~~c5621_g1_i1.p1  ORF type:complete len:236 (+),score=92.95 c5621_g1_i1:590-1297(+)